MKMLVFLRMLYPASKKASFDNREVLFEKTNYTINTPTKDGYVFSMSIRGADKAMKDYVLNDEGIR